jgi:hypothetical protein
MRAPRAARRARRESPDSPRFGAPMSIYFRVSFFETNNLLNPQSFVDVRDAVYPLHSKNKAY